ncbi:MAG TPA: hypothetical protein VFF32_03045 [Dermatophilaceae bacterium]|nr:hypothetical protein [Dermatophilaceae bacterium]
MPNGPTIAADFDLAPQPKTVDGLLAVPIDIASIDATLVFDGGTQTASADATITYTVGPTAGNPIFDLRQTVGQAWLDGAPFPPGQLAHHGFGTGAFTDLRVVESVQGAGSVHTLRLQYPLAMPSSQLGGAYLPALDWSAGPRLRFVLGLSDLNRARYLEAWLPANLLFDQFAIDLDISVVNTLAAHSVITNGVVTGLGTNHWKVAFPSRFSALSPLLEIRATDTLEQLTGSVTLPVSGKVVSVETWKPAGAATDLAVQINAIKSLLTANENDYGGYLHDERFVAFFNGGGMEYEGGTTTSGGALAHETFHSWFARGIKPAGQADGWWDEAFTSFHDDGANDAVPLDFTDPAVVLCSRDPWQRHTPTTAYSAGNDFFKGMASLLGTSTLNTLMGDLYEGQKGLTPVSTARIEEHLLSRSGNPQVVGAFHRFVYGLSDPATAPDLWLRDDPADPGADAWGGAFWDSPDLWVRRQNDDGTTHQAPEYGQDNWFHARVRNKSGAGAATHFVVTFHAKGYAGTEFLYPADFLPSITAKAAFDLGPGETRVVKARWPRSAVPPAGSHTCLLAAVISRSDLPAAGKHVWESNNLAQKNLTVVDLVPNSFILIPLVISNWAGELKKLFDLEVLSPRRQSGLEVSLVHRSKAFFDHAKVDARPFLPDGDRDRKHNHDRSHDRPGKEPSLLDCGGRVSGIAGTVGAVLTSDLPELLARRFPDSWEAAFRGGTGRMSVEIEPFAQTVVGLKVAVAAGAKPGRPLRLDLVQRNRHTKQVIGGIAVEVNVSEAAASNSLPDPDQRSS